MASLIDSLAAALFSDRKKKEEEEKRRRESDKNNRIIREEEDWRGNRRVINESEFKQKEQPQTRRKEEPKKSFRDQVGEKTRSFIDTLSNTAQEAYKRGVIGPNTGSLQQSLAEDLLRRSGELAQKMPDTTIKVKTTREQKGKFGDKDYKEGEHHIEAGPLNIPVTDMGATAIPFLSSIPGEMIRSYGKTAERIATEEGREEIKKGAKQLPGQIVDTVKNPEKALELLENPSVQTGLDVSDFIPGVGILSVGAKKGTKEVLEKAALEKLEKEAAEKEALKVAEKELPLLDQTSGSSPSTVSDGAGASGADTLRPDNTTSMGLNEAPLDDAARTIPSDPTSTVTSSSSNKYTPDMSVDDVLEDSGFIAKYNSTTQEKSYLDELLTKAAGEREVVTNTKDINTAASKILRKIKEKPEYDETRLGDLVRGSITAKDGADAKAVLAQLEQTANIKSVENYVDDPNPWGYQGTNINIVTPKGNLAEIQIHTPETKAIQEALHPLYEEWRGASEIPVSVFDQARQIADEVRAGRKPSEELLSTANATEEAASAASKSTPAEELPLVEEAPRASGDAPGGGAGDSTKIDEDIQINPETGKLEKTTKPKYEFDLKSLDTPDDVKNTILENAKAANDKIQTARRGTISWKETRAMADALGMTVDEVEKFKPGKIWNAEQADAAVRLTLQAQEELADISKQIKEIVNSGEAAPQALQVAHLEAAARAQATLAAAIGNRSETARALNAAKMLKEALKDPTGKAAEKAIKMFAGDKEKAKEVIEKLGQFDPEDKLGMIKFLRNIKPSTPMEKITELWYNFILSGTSTHVVNTVANTSAALLSIPERAMSGAVDAAVTKVGAKLGREMKRDRYVAEATVQMTGLNTGIKNGIRRATHVMRNGVSEVDVQKFDLGREQAIKGTAGNIINIPTRALTAEDEFFKAINYDMEIQALALREVKNKGLEGEELLKEYAKLVAEPTPQMIESASDMAKKMTMQAHSPSAEAMIRFRELGSFDLPKLGKVKPMQFVIPFVTTTVNVVKYGAERSPLGILPTTYKLINGAEKGEVVDSAARTILGTAVAIPLAMYAVEGRITGAPPKERKARDAFYADGKLPWSIKIGDQWVEYSRIEPLNTVLSQIAIMHDAFEREDTTWYEGSAMFARDMARNIGDRTFMKGVGNLMDAMEDPERYASRFFTDIVGGFIPSLVASGARSTDNTVRKPEGIIDAFQARIPLLSQNVPGQESTYEPGGEAVRHTNEGLVRNIASNFLGMRTSEDKGTGLTEKVEMMQDINRSTREESDAKKEIATQFYMDLKGKSKEEKQAIVQQYKDEGKLDDEVLEKFVTIAKEQAKELDAEAKTFEGATSNRAKAEYLYTRLKAMPKEERGAYVKGLAEKKLITDGVMEELAKYAAAQKATSRELPLVE